MYITEIIIIAVNQRNNYNACSLPDMVNLYDAVSKNDKERVLHILSKGFDPNTVYCPYGNPLHKSVEIGNLDIIKLLIEYGINVNSRNTLGNTGLHLVSIDYGYEHDETCTCNDKLHAPCYSKCKHITEILVKGGANINARNRDCRTPLHLACKKNNHTVVKYLLQYGADVNIVDAVGNTSLHYAVRTKNIETIKLLLSYGIDVNVRSLDSWYSPLYEAILIKDFTIARRIIVLLLCYGADPNTRCRLNTTPLFASVDTNTDIMKLLLENGAKVNASSDDGATALHVAVVHRNINAVKVLLDYEANVNSSGWRGQVPLHHAACSYRTDIMKLLLDTGADPNVPNQLSRTPLYTALLYPYIENVKLLLDRGGDINYLDDSKRTPLSNAVPTLMCISIAVLVISHITLLEHRYADISSSHGFLENIRFIKSFNRFNHIKKLCDREFRIMKSVRLSDTESLVSYLYGDNITVLSKFVNNPKVESTCNTLTIYGDRVDRMIKVARKRYQLSLEVLHVMKDIYPFKTLPIYVISMIIDHLSTKELELICNIN